MKCLASAIVTLELNKMINKKLVVKLKCLKSGKSTACETQDISFCHFVKALQTRKITPHYSRF